ncbi:MAG: anti-phage dCTP deaminase [Lysobacteraceae bacterium]
MSARPKVVESSRKSASSLSNQQGLGHISSRESRELVIALSGPLGSGQDQILEELKERLEQAGYSCQRIKLSQFIDDAIEQKKVDLPSDDSRYLRLQSAGNQLRKAYGNQILAELAISKIATLRVQDQGQEVLSGTPPKQSAWLVDQLKHPEEVQLLERVYGNLFYMVGVFSNEKQRLDRLVNLMELSPESARLAMERDRNENFSHGQKLEKTLRSADFFIRNTSGNRKHISSQISRFVGLIHGKNGLTPTREESGMFAAHGASLRSACLSRQVGAAIQDNSGVIVSTGCNDVPKAGGGLYSVEHAQDNRCINFGYCSNDLHKRRIEQEIREHLEKSGFNSHDAKKIAGELREFTRIRDLIEFSRSVHAEMDAIISLARAGGASTKNCWLYTTTFPCHNCARHIVTSGITHVFYIEPYEKSLANELHKDDIAFDEEGDAEETSRVKFLHFEGVSPRKFANFFLSQDERKNSKGKVVSYPAGIGRKVRAQYLDSYLDYEKRITDLLAMRDLVSAEPSPNDAA